MAMDNTFGWRVLATGNKSEMSVGDATLYGDMAGGFAPIKDLWKTAGSGRIRPMRQRSRRTPLSAQSFGPLWKTTRAFRRL